MGLGRNRSCATIPRCARVILAVADCWRSPGRRAAADPLTDARRLYNAGQYEAADAAAREARAIAGPRRRRARRARPRPARALSPDRRSATISRAARESLRMVDPPPLDAARTRRADVGLAEALYFEERYGAAAELFESVRRALGAARHAARTSACSTGGRPRSIARRRRAGPSERPADLRADSRPHARGARRDTRRHGRGLLAGGRGAGAAAIVERAWQAAQAGWVRAPLASDRGVALAADLDRLVTQAIIPERAAQADRQRRSRKGARRR